jgi:transposase
LLHVVHHASVPRPPDLHAVGVDAWAWRRGHRYGTIGVNLETHRVVDLLPERSTEAVAQWLAQHPGIMVVRRDRRDFYATGITQGAPRAVQVVDRFPLGAKLRDVRDTCFLAHPTALKQAAANTAQVVAQSVEPVLVTERYRGRHRRPQHGRERQEHQRQQRHAARVGRDHMICQLYHEGMTVAAIARRLHINRKTVSAQLQRGGPPAPKTRTVRPADRVLTPYIPSLMARWRQGNVSGQQLWHAIEAQGYRHSSSTVRRFIAGLRRASEAGRPPEVELSPYTRAQGPSARSVSFLVVSRPEKRSRVGQRSLEQRCQVGTQRAQRDALALSFLTLVQARRGEELDAWRTQAAASEITPLARFSQGLKDDLAAIQAGLTLPWSNGVTEGQINRLKLLKRQGYGRANVTLLRQRLVPAS